jgi:hypothetical protein
VSRSFAPLRCSYRWILCGCSPSPESARFLNGIDNRKLEAETGRERLRESIAETRRVLDIVGEVLGPSALGDVFSAACADGVLCLTMKDDVFAELRRSHLDRRRGEVEAVSPPADKSGWGPKHEEAQLGTMAA